MNIEIQKNIAEALANKAPVVALESTLITHGLPYPDNIETAKSLENIVRTAGATPATIAVIGGTVKIGLSDDDFEILGNAKDVHKLNAADIPICLAKSGHGGTTVAGTLLCAHKAGIKIFATGGIGGVHRNVQNTWDISQDLESLTQYNVAVITAGAKAILDLPKTLEYLETKGVPVIGYGTDEFPAFWTRKSGLGLSWRIDTPDEAAQIIKTRDNFDTQGGIIIANPVAEDQSLPMAEMEKIIDRALKDADTQNISGKEITPYLLKRVRELTEGKSLAPNITLLENNARLAAKIAVACSGPNQSA